MRAELADTECEVQKISGDCKDLEHKKAHLDGELRELKEQTH